LKTQFIRKKKIRYLENIGLKYYIFATAHSFMGTKIKQKNISYINLFWIPVHINKNFPDTKKYNMNI